MTSDAPTTCSITVQSTPAVLDDLYRQILENLIENDFSEDDASSVNLRQFSKSLSILFS